MGARSRKGSRVRAVGGGVPRRGARRRSPPPIRIEVLLRRHVAGTLTSWRGGRLRLRVRRAEEEIPPVGEGNGRTARGGRVVLGAVTLHDDFTADGKVRLPQATPYERIRCTCF